MTKTNKTNSISYSLNFSTSLNTGVDFPSASHLNYSMDGSSSVKPNIIIKEFEDIEVKAISELNGDHLHDAIIIIESTFDNKLIKLDNKIHYFNGREWKLVNDDVARRHIANSMKNGFLKVTKSRIESTLAVLKDQILNQGRPNPSDLRVYFADKVFNLVTSKCEPHSIQNRNTRSLPVNFCKKYECSSFLDWLKVIFSDDLQKVDYLQEIIGWTLCRNNLGIEKAIMFLGPPRAGKGVLLRIMRLLHGIGASSFTLGELGDDKHLSAMRNVHIAIDSDSVGPRKADARSVMGLFKVITSNEPISVKLLYVQEPLDGPLNCKLCIASNSAPVMYDDSSAAANRWLPLIFQQSFLGREDPELFSKFEKEIKGIANWALEGLIRLAKRKAFSLPQSSLDQIETLKSDGSYLNSFIQSELTLGEKDDKLRCSELEMWDAYVVWATGEGRKLTSRKSLFKAVEDSLRSKGVYRMKSVWIGKKSPPGFYNVKPERYIVKTNVSNLDLPKTG
jgi:P4 family phage/plasmid primase-like protien